MSIPVTAITAGLLSLFLIVLSYRVIKIRRKNRISLGDGDNVDLRRAMRGQANFVEYAPVGIMLLFIAELQSLWIVPLTILAAILLAGRLMHGYAFAFTAGNVFLRTRGMQLTFIAIGFLAVINIAMPIAAWVNPSQG